MLSSWAAEQRMLEMQSLKGRSRWVLEEERHSRLEAYGGTTWPNSGVGRIFYCGIYGGVWHSR